MQVHQVRARPTWFIPFFPQGVAAVIGSSQQQPRLGSESDSALQSYLPFPFLLPPRKRDEPVFPWFFFLRFYRGGFFSLPAKESD